MSGITTHVLNTASGAPGVGMAVVLERREGPGTWVEVGSGVTGPDGRLGAGTLLPAAVLVEAGRYRLRFATGAYFMARGEPTFFPEVTVEFTLADPAAHYHVPLLLSPFGYSTYRGT